MLYFANPCNNELILHQMSIGKLGFISTPAQKNKRDKSFTWCADNGCFGKGYPGDAGWLSWLEENSDDVGTCKFATAPDVVGNAEETLERSVPHLPSIRNLGYRPALVAQDGLENLEVPWDEFDALFIGGSTEWKLGIHPVELTRKAKSLGKWVHMGRVNSNKRYKYAKSIGCDSVDGTYLTFGPNVNLPKLLSWIDGDF